jgi:transglutaminase-like putative cysteine protease
MMVRDRLGVRLSGWVAALGVAAAGFVLLLLPARRALRGRGHTVQEGIETLDDAVAACRRSGLQGWELVTFAQRLVYRKFRCYSCRNLWDTPAQAFRRGMGYCTQYNLALKQILERLGFDVRAVFSLKVRVADAPEWTMGHTWLRVRVAGEQRDVCAGHADNLPGRVNFVPVAPVLPGNAFVFTLTHLGMIGFCGVLEWRALLSRGERPDWMFQAREL